MLPNWKTILAPQEIFYLEFSANSHGKGVFDEVCGKVKSSVQVMILGNKISSNSPRCWEFCKCSQQSNHKRKG